MESTKNTFRVLVGVPPTTVTNALHIKRGETVNSKVISDQHYYFRNALQQLGYTVESIHVQEETPNGSLLADAAIIVPGNFYIKAHFSHNSRHEEDRTLLHRVSRYFRSSSIHFLESRNSFLEGADVVPTKNVLYISLSKKTNLDATEEVRLIVGKYSYKIYLINLPNEITHLQHSCSYHLTPKGAFIVTTESLAKQFSDSQATIIVVPDFTDSVRQYGASCISREGKFLVQTGCDEVAKAIESHNFTVNFVDLSEFGKFGGAMTLLCVFYTPYIPHN